mmetsp:Transcript_50588/g.130426  ORF Transcript_50588/g.130426 Transcript_50588/m.130426 type:complete len:222 (+) Transcript_50588:156-821(+)
MSHIDRPVCDVYPIANYQFGKKERKLEKDRNVQERMNRMREKYPTQGMKRSAHGILVVHDHGHPHVLLIRIANTFYKLPGGKIKPDESEEEGLQRKLSSKLSPVQADLQFEWKVGDLLAEWWRPNFDVPMYPYPVPHIEDQKECKRIYFVHLPERSTFEVPANLNLVAVPLFELHEKSKTYGSMLASIPHMLSRLKLNLHKPQPSPQLMQPDQQEPEQQGQ